MEFRGWQVLPSHLFAILVGSSNSAPSQAPKPDCKWEIIKLHLGILNDPGIFWVSMMGFQTLVDRWQALCAAS